MCENEQIVVLNESSEALENLLSWQQLAMARAEVIFDREVCCLF